MGPGFRLLQGRAACGRLQPANHSSRAGRAPSLVPRGVVLNTPRGFFVSRSLVTAAWLASIGQVAVPPHDELSRLIELIRDGSDAGWAEFVQRFSPLLLQAARTVERDRDAAPTRSFIFERPRERRGARLASHDPTRPGSSRRGCVPSRSTWPAMPAPPRGTVSRMGRHSKTPAPSNVSSALVRAGFSFDQTAIRARVPGLTESHLCRRTLAWRTVTSQQR